MVPHSNQAVAGKSFGVAMPFNVALVFEIKVLICVAAYGAVFPTFPNGRGGHRVQGIDHRHRTERQGREPASRGVVR